MNETVVVQSLIMSVKCSLSFVPLNLYISSYTCLPIHCCMACSISFPFCNSISFDFVVVHNNFTMVDHRVLSDINVLSVFDCPLI